MVSGGGELSRGTPATGANSVPGPARPQVFGGHENPWNRHEKFQKSTWMLVRQDISGLTSTYLEFRFTHTHHIDYSYILCKLS